MAKRPKTPEEQAKVTVLLRANMLGCRLFRNNTGVAYDDTGRPVFFGLGNEGKKGPEDIRTPDDVGWHLLTITPEMVGKRVAVFTAIDSKKVGFKRKEVYRVGTQEYGQNKFFQLVQSANGIAGFASCAADIDELVNDFYTRITR